MCILITPKAWDETCRCHGFGFVVPTPDCTCWCTGLIRFHLVCAESSQACWYTLGSFTLTYTGSVGLLVWSNVATVGSPHTHSNFFEYRQTEMLCLEPFRCKHIYVNQEIVQSHWVSGQIVSIFVVRLSLCVCTQTWQTCNCLSFVSCPSIWRAVWHKVSFMPFHSGRLTNSITS